MPTADEIRAAQRALWDEFSPGWEKWGRRRPEAQRAGRRSDDRQPRAASGSGASRCCCRYRRSRSSPSPPLHQRGEWPSPTSRPACSQRRGAGLRRRDSRTSSSRSARWTRFPMPTTPSTAPPAASGSCSFLTSPPQWRSSGGWCGPEGRSQPRCGQARSRTSGRRSLGAAIAAELEQPASEPDAPGMFRCAAPGAMTSLFEGAGLQEVRV